MKIFVYGTGCGAGELLDGALPIERVTAFVDGQKTAESFLGRPVITPEELAARDCDLVIVTSRRSEEIAARCRELGIDEGKLLFLKNHLLLSDRNRSYERAEETLGGAFVEKLRGSERLIRAPLWSEGEPLPADRRHDPGRAQQQAEGDGVGQPGAVPKVVRRPTADILFRQQADPVEALLHRSRNSSRQNRATWSASSSQIRPKATQMPGRIFVTARDSGRRSMPVNTAVTPLGIHSVTARDCGIRSRKAAIPQPIQGRNRVKTGR